MEEDSVFTCYGTICDDCEFFACNKEPKYPGCEARRGKPFWGLCPTFTCVEEHCVEHCGLCPEFPCEKFISVFDPSQGQISSVIRAGILAYRAKHGDEKAAELARKITH